MEMLEEFIGTSDIVEMEQNQLQEDDTFFCTTDGCETKCSYKDEGVNPFMRYCNSCNIKLHADLSGVIAAAVQINDGQLEGETTIATDDNDDKNADEHAPSMASAAILGDMTLDEIRISLVSLIRAKDKRQVATIRFGEVNFDIKYNVDFINGGPKTKKLFVKDDMPVLYWWELFMGMQSSVNGGKTFICPCRIKGTDLVLVYVFRTRCNKPHYDCLVYDIVEDKAYVKLQAERWEATFECDPTTQDYSLVKMNRAVTNWITIGRWRYDSERGLRIETKNPQMSDTALKEQGYGVISAAANSIAPDQSGVRNKRSATPVTPYRIDVDLVASSSVTAGKKRKKRPHTHRSKKPKVEAHSDEDPINEDDDQEFMEMPFSKTRAVNAAAQQLPIKTATYDQSNEIANLKRMLAEATEKLLQQNDVQEVRSNASAENVAIATFPADDEHRVSNFAGSSSLANEHNRTHGSINQYLPRVQMNQNLFGGPDFMYRQVLEQTIMTNLDLACDRDVARHEALENFKALKRAECQQQQQSIRAALSLLGHGHSFGK